jgi:hypothetical protein
MTNDKKQHKHRFPSLLKQARINLLANKIIDTNFVMSQKTIVMPKVYLHN